MNIQELIDELEYIKEQVGDEAEVRFASQPAWPFEYNIQSAIAMTQRMAEDAARREMIEEGLPEEEIEKNLDNLEEVENVVYLAEGYQIGYLPGNVKDELGW